ncbi:MAG: zinc-ribbon domain-containing protein [Chitinivibrionales bacterium]|nr:zinc-ribbon domain-containing protein [Chitinivibrionales bacterium]
MSKRDDTVICPHCGAEIPRNARACRQCGSDDQTGWSDNTYMDPILPDQSEYEEIYANEFEPAGRKKRFSVIYIAAAVVLILLFVAYMSRGIF